MLEREQREKEREEFLFFFFFLRRRLFCSMPDAIQYEIKTLYLESIKIYISASCRFFPSVFPLTVQKKHTTFPKQGIFAIPESVTVENCCLALKGTQLRITQLPYPDSSFTETRVFWALTVECFVWPARLCTLRRVRASCALQQQQYLLTGLQDLVQWIFSMSHDSFLCGAPMHRELDQLRNQSVSHSEVVLRKYNSLGQNMHKAINPQNTKLVILPTVIAFMYASIMEML